MQEKQAAPERMSSVIGSSVGGEMLSLQSSQAPGLIPQQGLLSQLYDITHSALLALSLRQPVGLGQCCGPVGTASHSGAFFLKQGGQSAQKIRSQMEF